MRNARRRQDEEGPHDQHHPGRTLSRALGSSLGKIVLAPMEGLADDVLRAVLTQAGGYDWCVTEFVRVTSTLLPHSLYTRTQPGTEEAVRAPPAARRCASSCSAPIPRCWPPTPPTSRC
jgi:hypothetical protein